MEYRIGLLSVPVEVNYDSLFPYLEYNDLLRLRRVCKQLKIFSDDYIRNHFHHLDLEREINDNGHTFQDYLKCDLPTTTKKFYLNNYGLPISFRPLMNSVSPAAEQFLKSHGFTITHLRIRNFCTEISPAEMKFFTELKSLEHLEIETVDGYGINLTGLRIPQQFQNDSAQQTKCQFPPNFCNLKTLKINEIQCSRHSQYRYIWDLIDFCPKLEHLQCPRYNGVIDEEEERTFFDFVQEYIERRHSNFPHCPNLKYFDLQHCRGKGYLSSTYARFACLCYHRGVKLLNVGAQLHRRKVLTHMLTNENNPRIFYNLLTSLINVNGTMFQEELPNLERLVITHTSLCCLACSSIGELPNWPGLKALDVTIDSERLDSHENCAPRRTSELMEFLFNSVQREVLKELCIRFEINNVNLRRHPHRPKVTDITGTCKNVTKFTLTNWLGGNDEVARFWGGLPHLEEVTVEDCRWLTREAFVGEDAENPVFLTLTKLTTVTLSGLDAMTYITDSTFEQVFCHLKVKCFYLRSRKPISSISTWGIRSLLSGQFNNYVEKFPFDGWSLENVSREQFTQLKLEFRASYML